VALSLHVDLVHPVDHDLGDGGIVEEALQRAVAQDVVGDVLDQAGAFFPGERDLLAVDDARELLTGSGAKLLLRDRGVVEAGTHAFEQCSGRPLLQCGKGVHGLLGLRLHLVRVISPR